MDGSVDGSTTTHANERHRNGGTLIDSTAHIPQQPATKGVMGSVQPSRRQQADIDFGWPLLEQVVDHDAGGAIAVRERDVIAVEAAEGTEAMIARAGELCHARGWTLLKTAKSAPDGQAERATIGVDTIEHLAKAGAGCIALGAGRVLLIDTPKVIKAADRAKIAVVGV